MPDYPKITIFDLDDTLYPEYEFVLSGFRAVDTWLRTQRGLQGFYEIALAEFEKGSRGNIFNLALQILNIDSDSNFLSTLVRVYRDHDPRIALYKDAEAALARIHGFSKIGILTDGYHATQARKVAALGVEKYVHHVVYSDLLGKDFWKPHRRPYEEVMKRFSCAGQECVYIADNPKKDFITAKKLGWQTVRVRRSRGEHSLVTLSPEYEAHLEISDLNQLPY
jgi:putative hydrolase of the HAD superfamily